MTPRRARPRLPAGRALAAACFLLVASSWGISPARSESGAAAGDSTRAASDRERYLDLLGRKERAERMTALLKQESELAGKRTAYAVLGLSERKLYLKIRGRVFKSIPLRELEIRAGAGLAGREAVAWRSFTLLIKEGRGVETESIERASLQEEDLVFAGEGASSSEPHASEDAGEQLVSEPVPAAGVAGGAIPPDPPPRYHLGFDGGLSVWVQADLDRSAREKIYDAFLPLAKALGGIFEGRVEAGVRASLIVRLPLPLARQIYRHLLPGQKLLITG